MKKLIIDKSQWVKGISTTEMDEDGGYSPISAGFNLFRDEYTDVLTPSEYGIDLSGVIDDDFGILDIVKNETLTSGVEFYYVTEDGKHYSINNLTVALAFDDSANASRYDDPYVNQIVYNNSFFTTKRQNVVMANADYSVVDEDWFSTITGNSLESYPHPMEVVEGLLYIADHGNIHLYDGTNITEDIISLGPFQVITEMIAHPNGRDLMVFASEGGLFTSGTGQNRVYFVDLLTYEFYSEKEIDFPVDVAKIIGGTVYVTGNRQGRDNYVGTFDGEKIQKMTHPEIYQENNIYQRHVGKFGNFLCMPARDSTDEAGVLAFGKVKGENRFFKPWRKVFDTDEYVIESIYEYDAMRMLVFLSNITDNTREIRRIDFTETGNSNIFEFKMYSNRMKESQKSWIRRVDVYLENPLESGQGDEFYMENYSNMTAEDDPETTLLGEMEFSSDGAVNWKRFTCNIRTDDFQLFFEELSASTKRVKIKRVEIYLENEE